MLCYIMLSFGRIWVIVGVVGHPTLYPMSNRDSFPGGEVAGA
jgi:hypothetical protein